MSLFGVSVCVKWLQRWVTDKEDNNNKIWMNQDKYLDNQRLIGTSVQDARKPSDPTAATDISRTNYGQRSIVASWHFIAIFMSNELKWGGSF